MNLPEAFLARMKQMLGEEYDAFLDSYQNPRQYGLRVNTLKITPELYLERTPFSKQRIPWVENGFFYQEDELPSKHPYYFAGMYYLQEPSAMTPASRLAVKPKERVLDLCAAPGGKATELAAQLKGEGVLVANEISTSRARALLKNMEMMGISNALITNETPGNLARQFESYFDKILVDAPCSGEGMFRKEPEVAEVWDEERPCHFAKVQKDILDQAVKMLKPGGKLLYSTCTFSAEENEGSIARLLRDWPCMQLEDIEPFAGFSAGNPEWGDGNPQLAKCVHIWPHKMDGEGHFMALLQKEGELTEEKVAKVRKPYAGMTKQQRTVLEEFFCSVKTDRFLEGIEIRGENVYQVPSFDREIRGIKFLRSGLQLGTMKKNRFEPAQSFAMALRAEEYDSILRLDLEDDRVERYLKGETLLVKPGETKREKGWQLVCAEEFPLGWGKLVNGVLKNKYLNAWRKN